MRGGRNKFGPMYKYDRALRQQALRQSQLLLAQGLHHQQAPSDQPPDFLASRPSVTPPDVKPDISQLSTVAAATSRLLHEPVPVPGDVSISPLGEFYRSCGSGDPGRLVTASASAGLYPVPSSRLGPESYPPRQNHRRYYPSVSYGSDVDMSAAFCGSTQAQMSQHLTPLAGLSHMMNDVPNFVGQSQSADSRLLLPPPQPRNYPTAVQSRNFISPSSHLPAPPHRLPVDIRPAPEDLPPRHSRGAVPPLPSSFAPILPESTPPPQFSPPYRPRQSSQGATLSPVSPPSSRARLVSSDVLLNTSLPSPATTYSAASALVPGPLRPVGSPCPLTLSDFVAELRRNEPNQRDVQKKLSNVLLAAVEEQRRRHQSEAVDSPPSSLDDVPSEPPPSDLQRTTSTTTSELRQSMEVVCKVCDQMLFMMVEWARGARFFRELKVRRLTDTGNLYPARFFCHRFVDLGVVGI